MSVAQIETLYTEAVAALEAGNYDVAIVKALQCKIRLASTPNVARSLAGGGQQSLQWANAVALDSFIKECKSLKATALAAARGGPIQRTKIIYERPSNIDCY